MKSGIPIKDLDYMDLDDGEEAISIKEGKLADFITWQNHLMKLVKKECSLIVVTTTATGTQRFDLPSELLRDKSPKRARKDSYTALLLANWGKRCYFDMLKAPQRQTAGFVPRFVA